MDDSTQLMRFLPVRAGAVLVELENLENALALMASLESDPIPEILELIPAARTVMVVFDAKRIEQKNLAARIASRDLVGAQAEAGPLVEIPIRYDGDDLSELATLLDMPVSEIIRRHTASRYKVAFTGFAPGFAYLTGDDPKLAVPRRTSPRTRVPAGSVALGGAFCGVYPKDSPGGWQLIGSTDVKMFDLERDPAALLQPGYRVRFIDVSQSTQSVAASAGTAAPSISTARTGGSRLEIMSTLFPLLLQDEGRPRQSRQGVSVSGAADKASYRIANRLVGNQPGTPALEITLGQVRFKVIGKAFVALAGAPAPVTIKRKSGTEIDAGRFEVLALADGDIISVGAPRSGLRSYLAARGGFDVQPVLGSVSRDTLAQIGPEPLLAGTAVGILAQPESAIVSAGESEPFPMPVAGATIVLDVTLGPRADWFTKESVESFLTQEWKVTPQSSRAGVRLHGQLLERLRRDELPSEATLQGAVQVPASGQPVLFLADHPVTGGYPVIANVAAHHLDLVGQLPPGTKLRFNMVPLPQM